MLKISSHNKFFLCYLILTFIVIVLFVLLERFTYLFTKDSYFLYSIVLIVIFLSISISYLLSRFFSLRFKKVLNDLKKIEEGKYEKISIQSNNEIEGLSQVINRISRKIREREQKLNILFEITRFVSSLLHLQHVLDAIVDLLTREFKIDACSIRLLNGDGNLRIKSQKGLSKKFVETATRKPTVDSYSGECFLTGKIVIINDVKDIDKPISTTLLVGEDIKSFAVTPIEVEGNIIGVLVTASKKKNYFHERFNDVIYTIAKQIGIAIRVSQLYDEIYIFSQELEKKVRERTSRLEEKSKQLVEAEKLAALGKMANRVADECRNSLTVVGGFARRLYGKTPDDDPNKKDLEIIVEEVKVLEDKISRIVRIEKKD